MTRSVKLDEMDQAIRAEFEAKIRAGKPVMTLALDLPITVMVGPAGEVTLDFEWRGVPMGTVMARLALSSDAARELAGC